MSTFADKVTLVTGSSRGIGAAIATSFAVQGARVVLHGRDEVALGSVKADIEKNGGTVMYAVADVTKFAEIESMRSQIERKFGPVDVLVANAGGNPVRPGPLEEITEDGWRASIDGNLTATFLTIKSFLPSMKQRASGNIITISSTAGRRGNGISPIAYAAAKAGIEILTKHLAAQVGPFGIRVNCIAPEAILTERSKQRIPQEQQQTMVNYHPIRRLGTPEDIAQAALFLASDDSSWITGVILDVTGGAFMA